MERDDSRSGKEQPQELRLMDLEITSRSPGTAYTSTPSKGGAVFQTQLREMEQELRTTSSLARTSSTGGGRVRGNVPESLANRLGPLAMETGAAAPVAPSSDVRARLGTAPPPRTQPSESRLGRSVDQNWISSQTVSRRSDTPATATPASTTGQSTSAMPTEGVEPNSVLLWNRPDPSGWGAI